MIVGRPPLINLEPLRSFSSYFWPVSPLRGSRTLKGNSRFLGFEPKRALINHGVFVFNEGELASKGPLCELEHLVMFNMF